MSGVCNYGSESFGIMRMVMHVTSRRRISITAQLSFLFQICYDL